MSFPVVFFFNDTATTEIYTLSLHDALPILRFMMLEDGSISSSLYYRLAPFQTAEGLDDQLLLARSEEHTSELQSQSNLVCRLLLEKKKHCARSYGEPKYIAARRRDRGEYTS